MTAPGHHATVDAVLDYSTPATITVPADGDLTDAVFANAAAHPDDVCFARKSGGGWEPVTCREFAAEVTALAKGLAAAGVGPGDRVALMSATRYEWTLIDYAIWAAGAVTVPIYETSSPDQIEWILSDSEAVAAFFENATLVGSYQEVAERLPGVRHCWQIEDGAVGELVTTGRDVDDAEIARRRAALSPDSLATVIYTSGTTGRPKGCELTHGNFLFDALSATDGLDELFGPEQSTLLFLPLAHVFARLIQVGCVLNRVRMGHSSDIRNLLEDFQAFRPTFILSVPRVFEKVYTQAKQKAHADGKGRIFDAAERSAILYSEACDSGGPNPLVRLTHALFDRLVYGKLRAALGGQVIGAISGGAPLGARLGHFFRGVGVPVYEGYGLTETTAGATLNRPDAMKVGTVGRPLPGVAVRIDQDGEILLHGDNVFRGYWHNDQATKEALESDGWFHTGDIGELDDEGYLRITGRKKELIVTAGGKNVAPAVLEDRLRAHPLISQAMVVGDQRPFVGALLTLDEESLPGWLSEHGKPESMDVAALLRDDDVVSALRAAVQETNRAVSKAESIRAFRVLPQDFTVEGGEMTPTLKLKRAVILGSHADEVEALYSGDGISV